MEGTRKVLATATTIAAAVLLTAGAQADARADGRAGNEIDKPATECQPVVDRNGDAVVVTWCDPGRESERAVNEIRAEADRQRRPERVTVRPPRYRPGTLPTVTSPAVEAEPPTVTKTGETITVTITPGIEVTPPTVTPGQSGTLDLPGVTIG